MASDAFVGGQHHAEAVDSVRHVIGQVDIFADRGEQGGLFAPAKRKVIGLIVHAERLVGAHKRIVRVERRMVKREARLSWCGCRCRTRPSSKPPPPRRSTARPPRY